MRTSHARVLLCALVMLTGVVIVASPARAQLSMTWWTVDCGGGTSTAGAISIQGTAGQFDAGPEVAAGSKRSLGGFWPGAGPRCRADFNGDGAATVSDIFAFLTAWFAGNPAADFDGAGGVTVGDIFAFLTAWFAGCG